MQKYFERGIKMKKENDHDYVRTGGVGYYAQDPVEAKFDDWIRDRVIAGGSKAEVALYVQGQEILNQIRWLRDQILGVKPE